MVRFFRSSHTSTKSQMLEFEIIQNSNKNINGILFSVFVGTHQTNCESKLEKISEKPEKQLPFPWKLQIEDLVKYSTGNGTLEQYHIICNAILITNKHALVAASCALRGHDPAVLRKESEGFVRYSIEDHFKYYNSKNAQKKSFSFVLLSFMTFLFMFLVSYIVFNNRK